MSTDLDAELADLIRNTHDKIRAVLLHFGIPEFDAGDIVQEAVLQLVRKRATVLDPPAWLVGTVRRECLYYWRRKRQRLTYALDDVGCSLATAPEQEGQLLRHDLQRAIRSLRPRCQDVIQHRFFLGSSTAETATSIGCTESSLDKIIRRCLDTLSHRMLRIGRTKRTPSP